MSAEAEQSVIGSLLHDNRSLFRIDSLEPEDFENVHLGAAYGLLRTAINQGKPVDAVTLGDIAPDQWRLALQCTSVTPSARNVAQYAQAVRYRGQTRKARQLLIDAIDRLDHEGGTEVLGSVMADLATIATGDGADESFCEVLMAAVEARTDEEQGQGKSVSTTMPTLDRLTGGYRPGRFYILGGRPGTYKSVLGWQTCLQAAEKGIPSGIISLEMPSEELGDRAMRARHDNADLPIRVDTRSRDIGEIEGRITEWVRRYSIRIAVVDYLQIINNRGVKNRFDALSDISRRFKELAMRLRLPVLVLAQVSREVEKEKRAPRLSDLRECGNLEQDADGVIFTSCIEVNGRDEYSLINAKQRGAIARTKPIFLDCDGAGATVRETV